MFIPTVKSVGVPTTQLVRREDWLTGLGLRPLQLGGAGASGSHRVGDRSGRDDERKPVISLLTLVPKDESFPGPKPAVPIVCKCVCDPVMKRRKHLSGFCLCVDRSERLSCGGLVSFAEGRHKDLLVGFVKL